MGIAEIIAAILADTPEIISDVKLALQKRGLSNAEIDAIFSAVVPRDQLGILPDHPVAPEPIGSGTAPEPQPPVTSTPTPTPPPVPSETAKPAPAQAPHIFAR